MEVEGIHVSIFSKLPSELAESLTSKLVFDERITNLKVYFVYDPLGSIEKDIQLALDKLKSQNLAASNILHSVIHNLNTIQEISAYNVCWEVSFKRFIERVPFESMMMGVVLKNIGLSYVGGFKGKNSESSDVPKFNSLFQLKGHEAFYVIDEDEKEKKLIYVHLKDNQGNIVIKYCFRQSDSSSDHYCLYSEERVANIPITYLEGVTSNVVLGLVGELNLPYGGGSDHHRLLDSREKAHVIILAEYLGLNHHYLNSQYNECGIRMEFC